MKYRQWFTNRVVIGMVLFFVIMAMWEFKWKPQYRPFYENGVAAYQKGDYRTALTELNRAYAVAPNALDVIVMLGWTNLKLNHYEDARFYFGRALRIDPRTEEAQIGSSFVALETGRGRIDPKIISKILETRKGDPNVLILTAAALGQEGEYRQAAQIYRGLLDDKDYGHAARIAYNLIYGLDGFEKDRASETLADPVRPPQLQVPYRAAESALWRNSDGNWEKWYVNGVDIGPGAPGYYPLAPPTSGELYEQWVRDAAALNANAVRAYVLLQPAFYRAYRHYREGGGKMALIQQIWVGAPPDNDLYTPAFVDATKQKIRNVIDALHGRGIVPPSREQSSGIYEQDVAAGVAGIMLGGELDDATYAQTNVINGGKSRRAGHYVSIEEGSASEVWFAEMLDYLVEYETSTYNWQHPVAIQNGPQHDPARGEVTEEKLHAQPAYAAGLFATYNAFPYYPESLTRDTQYLGARDAQGPNPVYGYLRLVRSRVRLPLVVTDFGISTSLAARQLQVGGWNQGGHNEQAQAERLLRLRQTIQDTGCAGGIVFELADEWYRQGWMREGFETPLDRGMLWLNELDPNKRYGLIGYRTRKWKLFAGDPAEWKGERQLYGPAPLPATTDGYEKQRELRSVQVAADEAYLYMRVAVGCLDCVKNRRDGKTHLDQAAYAIAINTLPEGAGLRRIPIGNTEMRAGANFLLYLGTPEQSRLLVADNYNPYEVAPRADYPKEIQLRYKRGFRARAASNGAFIPFPAANGESPSVVHYGSGNAAAKDYNSGAEWYADVAHSAIIARIPWGKLMVVDPSRLNVFAGFDEKQGVSAVPSPGLSVSVFALKTNGSSDLAQMTVAAWLPASTQAQPEVFSWERWDAVKPESYFKRSYFALQAEFAKASPAAAPHATGSG